MQDLPPCVGSERNGFIAPANEVEEAVAAIWSNLLNVTHLSRYDDFIELGGDSILALQVVSRLQVTFHIPLTLNRLFAATTIVEVAEVVMQLLVQHADPEVLENLLAELEQD